MKKLLSICITSYNRPKELRRCLESIHTKYVDQIEIIISEDKSPKREEIREQIKEFCSSTPYVVITNFNENNLGYDRNLAKLISLSTSEYVMFVSDDDAIFSDNLDQVITTLMKHKSEIACMYTAFKSADKFASNRKYSHNFIIPAGKESAVKYVYDAILFSGLIFKREYVKDLSAERFVNLNYFQIYMFLETIYHYGGYYKAVELINCIADGENGYGTTELSQKDPLLADRTSIFSDVQFNKGLVKVIKIFDLDENENIISAFAKEYSLRTYRGMARAEQVGKKELDEYWKMVNNIGIDITMPAPVYYRMLKCFGSKVCNSLFTFPKKILFSIRGNN